MAAPWTPCTELFRSHDGIQVLVIALRIVPRQSVYERGIGLCEDDFGVTCVYENLFARPTAHPTRDTAMPCPGVPAPIRARGVRPPCKTQKEATTYDSRFFSSVTPSTAPRRDPRLQYPVTLERNRDARRRLDMRDAEGCADDRTRANLIDFDWHTASPRAFGLTGRETAVDL